MISLDIDPISLKDTFLKTLPLVLVDPIDTGGREVRLPRHRLSPPILEARAQPGVTQPEDREGKQPGWPERWTRPWSRMLG